MESFSLIDVEKWVVCKWRKIVSFIFFSCVDSDTMCQPIKCQRSKINFIVNYLLFNSNFFFISCAAQGCRFKVFSSITMWNLLALNFWESSNSFCFAHFEVLGIKKFYEENRAYLESVFIYSLNPRDAYIKLTLTLLPDHVPTCYVTTIWCQPWTQCQTVKPWPKKKKYQGYS